MKPIVQFPRLQIREILFSYPPLNGFFLFNRSSQCPAFFLYKISPSRKPCSFEAISHRTSQSSIPDPSLGLLKCEET